MIFASTKMIVILGHGGPCPFYKSAIYIVTSLKKSALLKMDPKSGFRKLGPDFRLPKSDPKLGPKIINLKYLNFKPKSKRLKLNG